MSPEEYMTEMQGSQPVRRVPRHPEPQPVVPPPNYGNRGVNRAVHNSPPPLDDVGSDVSYMLDEKDPIAALLNDRHAIHGSFAENSHYGQILRNLFRNSPGWARADDRTREVLDYTASKLSRILSGRPNERQHWEDIAGYATLQFQDKQR